MPLLVVMLKSKRRTKKALEQLTTGLSVVETTTPRQVYSLNM